MAQLRMLGIAAALFDLRMILTETHPPRSDLATIIATFSGDWISAFSYSMSPFQSASTSHVKLAAAFGIEPSSVRVHSRLRPYVFFTLCIFALFAAIDFFFMSLIAMPNKSPEPTAVGVGRSAVAVHVASRRWLSFLR